MSSRNAKCSVVQLPGASEPSGAPCLRVEPSTAVTAVVLTRNEARHIGACLESLRWADALLVLDSGSTDDTVKIARRYTENVHYRAWEGFPKQRNAALGLASTPWVLFVDADERVTPELAAEVRRVLAERAEESHSPQPVGYWIPRRNIILGNWMQHTGWSPDHQLRLLRRELAHYDESREVHEVASLNGPSAYLESPFVHYNYETVRQFLAKQNLYASYQAETMLGLGVRVKPQNFVLQPLREFKRRYLEWSGYKDGLHGFFLSVLMAWFDLVTYVKLARLQKRR